MEEDLICKQCQNVYEKPMQFTCCAYTACECCLTKLFDNEVKMSCPNCNQQITKQQSEQFCENQLITKMIEMYNKNMLTEESKKELLNYTLESLDENSPEIQRKISQQNSVRYSQSSSYMFMSNDNYDLMNQISQSQYKRENQTHQDFAFSFKEYLKELALLQSQENQEKDQIQYCQRCAEKKSEVSCMDCGNIALCNSCSGIIHSLGIFVSHRIKKVNLPQILNDFADQEIQSCCIHPNQPLSQLCLEEMKAICQECFSDHQNHCQVSLNKAVSILNSELTKKQKSNKQLIKNLSIAQNRTQQIKTENQEEYLKQTNEAKSIFQNLKDYLIRKEKEILENFEQTSQSNSDYLLDLEQNLKDKLDKTQSVLQFTEQAKNNPLYTLQYGQNFLSEKLKQVSTQNVDIQNFEIPKARFEIDVSQITQEIQKIIANKSNNIQTLMNDSVCFQNTVRESQESLQITKAEQCLETSRQSSSQEALQQTSHLREKSVPYKQSYSTNQGVNQGKQVINQNQQYTKHHRKGNSHSSFTEFFSMKQHTQVLKEKQNRTKIHCKLEKNQDSVIIEDRCISKEDQELRFTFGKNKKESQVLMQSQIQNMSQKVLHSQQADSQRISENQDALKRKISNAAVSQYIKQSKDFKDQSENIITNKLKSRKHQKATPSNAENVIKIPNQNLSKTPIQSNHQTQVEKDPDSPTVLQKKLNLEKQKTPLQTNSALDFNNRKVITPKNQAGLVKKEFSLPQSKSTLKLGRPLYQYGGDNDISLSRMPTMREDSVDLQGESNFSLRRNSRNNIGSVPLYKQSTQQKLSNLINGTNSLQQSLSNSNLKQIISKPPELTKKEIKEMTAQPLMKRRFLVRASYSSSVQVSWSHPKGANIEGLRYILEYGVGIKVGNIEQFRQIYKGKAFKCIVTDLIPKTNYRFRVAAVLQREGKEEQGEWSDVESVSTTDIQQIDSQSLLNVAVIPPMQKCQSQSMVLQTVAMNQQNSCTLSPIQNAGGSSSGNDKWIQFERPGLIHSLNTLTFGKHYWSVAIQYTQNLNLNNEEFSGLMKLGVFSKNSTSQKIYGPVVNYSTSKGLIKIKFYLDYEQKQLKVYTQSNPKGEVYSEIPELGLYPAAQNMTMRSKNATLRISFAFDLLPFDIIQETGCIKDL